MEKLNQQQVSPGRFRAAALNHPSPLISIIVVVFRDRDELREVIHSILPHKTAEVEIVVIDGGSNDGTVELLEGFGDQIDFWVSEPDSGIYHAMNKGLRASTGDYILHINAGDRLRALPLDVLRRASEEKIDVVSGQVLLDGKRLFRPNFGFKMKIDNCWHHQGTFYRRQAHLEYDESYRICGDFDHNQRLLRAGASTLELPVVVTDHLDNGISATDNRGRKETYRSIRRNMGWFYLVPAFTRVSLIKMLSVLRGRTNLQ